MNVADSVGSKPIAWVILGIDSRLSIVLYVGLPRKLRIEYPGAMYHVMSRGDRREKIFLDPRGHPRVQNGFYEIVTTANRDESISVGNMKTQLKFTSILVACGFLLAGCCTPHRGTKWEYRTSSSLSEVNQLADQGWTVVNFAMPDAGPWQYLLKRAKP